MSGASVTGTRHMQAEEIRQRSTRRHCAVPCDGTVSKEVRATSFQPGRERAPSPLTPPAGAALRHQRAARLALSDENPCVHAVNPPLSVCSCGGDDFRVFSTTPTTTRSAHMSRTYRHIQTRRELVQARRAAQARRTKRQGIENYKHRVIDTRIDTRNGR